jgi:hypothetical protein
VAGHRLALDARRWTTGRLMLSFVVLKSRKPLTLHVSPALF